MLVARLSRSAGFRCVSAFRPVNDRPGRVDQQMKSDMMQDLIGAGGEGSPWHRKAASLRPAKPAAVMLVINGVGCRRRSVRRRVNETDDNARWATNPRNLGSMCRCSGAQPGAGRSGCGRGSSGSQPPAGSAPTRHHPASRVAASLSSVQRAPCLVRFWVADNASGGTVVLDGAPAAIRLPQPSGATVFADGGRQYVLCRAMGAAAEPCAGSDRAASRAPDAARSRLETVPGSWFSRHDRR